MVGNAKMTAGKKAAQRFNHAGTTKKLNEARSSLNEAQQGEQAAGSQVKFIQNSMASRDMDMAEAKEQGFLDAEPVEGQTPKFNTDPDTNDVKMSYVGTDGAPRAVNLTQKYKSAKAEQRDAGQRVEEAQSQVDATSVRKRRADMGKTVGKAGVKAGAFTTRTGVAAMTGGVGGNSYLAHSMGRRSSQPMITSEFGRASGGKASKPNEMGDEGNNDDAGGL
jgi:hypothetical protein